jgi:hypothetical protein
MVADSRHRQKPPHFRQEEVTYVMQRWRASKSCSLVGVGSVGKSNLLQHLANPETQRHYLGQDIPKLGDEPDKFKAIVIDPNLIGALPRLDSDNSEALRCWAGYELMMHRLYLAFYPFNILHPDEAQRFYDTYQAFQDGTNPLYAYMGLRYLELGLDYFLREGVRIVFMFDEFEEMLKQLPVKFFQTLRGLRDANKRQLFYLTFTRSPIKSLVNQYEIDALGIEPFTELFTDNLCYVGPYSPADGRMMINEEIDANKIYLSEDAIEFLMWSTGCYAGLLRAAFSVINSIGTIDARTQHSDELVRKLVSRSAVQEECRTIWTSLTPSEQHTLKAAVQLVNFNSNAETEQAVSVLVKKKLLHADRLNRALEIQPPVFRGFVATNPDGTE